MGHGRRTDPNSRQGRMRAFLVKHYIEKNRRPVIGDLSQIARIAQVPPENLCQAARQVGLSIDYQELT